LVERIAYRPESRHGGLKARSASGSSASIFQSKDDPEIDFCFQYKMILKT